MQTGLTSFLDRMISGAGSRQGAEQAGQRTSEGKAEAAGEGKGSAIAVEFARMLRVLRAEVQPDPDLAAGDRTSEEPGDEAAPVPHGWAKLHWNRHASDEVSPDKADDGETQETEDSAEEAVPDEVHGQWQIAPPRQHGEKDTAATQSGPAGEDMPTSVIDAKDRPRQAVRPDRNEEAVSGSAGTDEAQELAQPQDRPSPVRRAGSDGETPPDHGRTPAGEGRVQEAAPRGGTAQVRVELVSGETHLPPTMPNASTVQLLGDSIGEALNDMANAQLSGEVTQDGETVHQAISRRMVVELQPRELGTVRVTMLMRAGELHIEIVSTTDKANDLLNAHRDALTHSIRHAGAAVGEVSVRMVHDGGAAKDFQPGQNPAFNWNGGAGGTGGGGESGGGARHFAGNVDQGGQSWREPDNRQENQTPAREGIYL